MSLTTNKLVLTDGAPGGGVQDMRSSTWEVDGSENLGNTNYKIKPTAGNENDILILNSFNELELKSPNNSQITTINSATTIVNTGFIQNTYEVDTSSGEFNINIPAIATVTGQRYTFIKTTVDTNRVLMFGDGIETINGFPRWQLNAQFDSVTFIPNTLGWFVVILTPHIKTLSVIKDATVQSIPSSTPTVISFQTVLGVSPLNSFDNTINFDWDSKNGVYDFDISAKILLLDSNDIITVCLRFNGVIVACAEQRATFNNQNVAVRLQGQVSTFASPDVVLTGNFDVTVEHNQGSALDLDTDPIFTYFKMIRGLF